MTSNNIKVAIRVKPLLRTERDCKVLRQWEIIDKNIRSISTKTEPFYFDNIFDENVSNCELFDAVAKPIVAAAVNGTNGAIFAYGEASSGKTYTMLGDETNTGIITLTVKDIFKEIEASVDREFLLRVSYMELHNEHVYDLLHKQTKKNQQNENKKKQMKVEIPNTENATINCFKQILKNENEVIKILQTGKENRSQIGINIKEKSSKSHTIFRIVIESRKINRNSDDTLVQISTLDLVDLSSPGQTIQSDLVQSQQCRSKPNSITNKGLLTLSQIIKDLSEGKDLGNISYNNSKLTRILKEPLGNNALAAFICNIIPTTIAGTYSVLNFAMQIKNIQNVPKVNKISFDISMLGYLDKRISGLREQLEVENCNTNKKRANQLEKQVSNEQLKILRSHSKDSNIVKSNKKTKSLCTFEELIECPHDNIVESYRLREQDLGAREFDDRTVPTTDNPDLETLEQLIQDILLSDSSALDIDHRHELMLPKMNEFENFNLEEKDNNIKPILPIAVVSDLELSKQISQNDFLSDSSAHRYEVMLPKRLEIENFNLEGGVKNTEPALPTAVSDLASSKEISQNDCLSDSSAHRYEVMLPKRLEFENLKLEGGVKNTEPALPTAVSDLATPKQISQNDFLSDSSAHRYEVMLPKRLEFENFNLEGGVKNTEPALPTAVSDLASSKEISQNDFLSDSSAHRYEVMLPKRLEFENLKLERGVKNTEPALPTGVSDLATSKQISQNDFLSDSSAHRYEVMLPKRLEFENLKLEGGVKNTEPALPIAVSDLATSKQISQNDFLSDSSAHDTDLRHELMLPKAEVTHTFENLKQVLKHSHDNNDQVKTQIDKLQKQINQIESDKLLLRKKNLKDEEQGNEKLNEYKIAESNKVKILEDKVKEKETELRAISERCHQLESENTPSQEAIAALLTADDILKSDISMYKDKIKHLEFDIKRLSAFKHELKQQDDSVKQRETEYWASLNEKDAKIASLMNEISLQDTNQLVVKGKECKMLLVAPSSQENHCDTLDYENNNEICYVKDSKVNFKKYDELSIQLSEYFQESFKLEIQEETLSRKQSKKFSRLQEPKKVVKLIEGFSTCTLSNKPKDGLSLCQRKNEILKNCSKFCNDNHIVKNFVSYLDNLEASYNQLEIDIEDTNNILENMVNRFTCSNNQQLNLVDDTDSIMPKKYQIKYLRYILNKFIYSLKDINLNHTNLLHKDHKYDKQNFPKQINILLHNSLIQLPRQLSLLNNPILYSLYKIDFTIQKFKAIIEYQEDEKMINKHEIERINVFLQQSYDEREQIKTKYASLISEYNTMKMFIEVFKNEFTECLCQLDTLSGSTAISDINKNILIAIRNILKGEIDARYMENIKVQFKTIKYQINKKLSEKSEEGEIEMKNNTKLLNKISELNLEVSKLKNKLTQLETDKILLEQKLQQNKSCSDFESISSEIRTALLQNCALENDLLSKIAECDLLRNEFELCQITLNKCEKQNSSLILRIQNNDILLKQAEDEYNSLRASINLIQDELLKERKSEALSQKNIALQDEINTWQQKHADALSMYNKNNRQCLLYKTKITSLENAVKYQQDEVKAWQDKYADVLNKLNKEIEQHNQLNINNITLKTTIKELELKLEKNLNDKNNNSISQKQYDDILKQCNKYQDEINNLQNFITKLNKKNTENRKAKNQMQDINIDLKKEMKIIKEKYDDTSKELSEATVKCLSYKNELLEYKISSTRQTEWKDKNNERIHNNLKEDIKAWEYKYDNVLKRKKQDLDLYNNERIRLENTIKTLNSTQLELSRKNEKLTIILENIYDKLKQQLTIETLPQKFALHTNSSNIKSEKNIFIDGDEIYAQRQEELIDHLIEDHKNLKLKNEKLIAEINSTRIACQQERKVRRHTLHDEKRHSVAQ